MNHSNLYMLEGFKHFPSDLNIQQVELQRFMPILIFQISLNMLLFYKSEQLARKSRQTPHPTVSTRGTYRSRLREPSYQREHI